MLCCARATEGLAWIMSIGAIVNVKDGSSLGVRDRQDIYWMRRCAKMIEELDAENNRGRQW